VPAPPAVPQTKEVHPDALKHPQAAAVSRKRPLDRDRGRCGRAARHAVRRRRRRRPACARRRPQPVVEPVAGVLEGDADHREQQRLRHAAVEQSTTGGGAIYGCRAKSGTKACLRASNLSNGRAFSFATSSGTEVGRIEGPTASAPFTTTATGVATGLNADKVDGKDAATISADANLFANVSPSGALGAQRGATAASNPAAGTYNVAFSDDISKCALGATVNSNTVAGIATAVLGADNKTVTVVTRDAVTPGTPVNQPFHLTVTC
jgi:hypothetical protein